MTHKKLSPSQLRAARGLLNWSRPDLAKRTGVSEQTIHRFENDMGEPETRTQDKIYRVLDENGLEFTHHNGVQFKPRDVEIYEGRTRYDDFYDYLYEHLKATGGNACVVGPSARIHYQYRSDPDIHRNRMRELQKKRSDILMRVLLEEGDDAFPGIDYCEYRWLPKAYALPAAFYVFGSCLALISYEGPTPPFVILIKSPVFSQAYRRTFNLAWRAGVPPSLAKSKRRP